MKLRYRDWAGEPEYLRNNILRKEAEANLVTKGFPQTRPKGSRKALRSRLSSIREMIVHQDEMKKLEGSERQAAEQALRRLMASYKKKYGIGE